MWILSLAVRNLIRNTRRTVISGSAVALTVALMVTSSNLEFGSWQDRLDQSISAVSGHVVVQPTGFVDEPKPEYVVTDSGAAAEALRAALPEARILRRIFVGGLLKSPRNAVRIAVQGVDPEQEQAVSKIDDVIASGIGENKGTWIRSEASQTARRPMPDILVGRAIAMRLEVEIGDKVRFDTVIDGEQKTVGFRVRGIYDTGVDATDGFTAIAPLEALQTTLPGGVATDASPFRDPVHQISVLLPSSRGAEQAAATVREVASREGADVLVWSEALPKLYQTMKADRDVSSKIYLFILGIVAIVILTTMLMSVLERTREFGVLLAIGMRPRHLVALILCESLFLGILSAAAGLLLQIPFSLYLINTGIDMGELAKNSVDVTGVVLDSVIYARWDVQSMLLYSSVAVFLTAAAGVWPAWRATRLTPVDAMRGV